MKPILQMIKKHSSTILCLVAAGGVVTTAVLAAKETPKAVQLLNKAKEDNKELTKTDTVKTVAPAYIPAVISGVLTVTCIFGANVLNKKQQAAITSAYALLSSNYKRYSGKLKELYGEEAHKNILEALAVEKADKVPIYAECCCGECSLGFEDTDEEKILFFDSYSERYFESTISQVLQAEYHLNRNFAISGDVTLNDFYLFLGIDKIDGGDNVGWSTLGGYCWIDFANIPSKLEDGTEYHIISSIFAPEDCSEEFE